ncbi:Asp/Glu/hydantoin racemase [Humitalea rosea]|uniref:Asp/Glu/hydantoin racemase n=1 Tax=Humitalea rosea TaxID=990373 RepID=A0A2W7IWL3_9PROT|nr:aspartate/glutamate racemase family protein [Humitalea rosea]PZW43083.1 Asp/Glu/hydantoin racemase [Humitalea rosea]
MSSATCRIGACHPPRIIAVTELNRGNAYSAALVRLGERALGERAVVETFGLPPGTYGGKAVSVSLGNAFIYHRILDRIIDQAITAEREGYDAFIIGSFSEPFLAEIRAVVDIPVVSIFETTLLVGCSLGTKLGFVTTSGDVKGMIEKTLPQHGLGSRVAAVLALDPPLEGKALHASFETPEPMLTGFERAAERALAMGADVLIPAEGIIAALLTDRGIFRFRDAPVMDVFGVTWSYACMLAELRASSGLGVTRRGRYAPPDPELFRRLTEGRSS